MPADLEKDLAGQRRAGAGQSIELGTGSRAAGETVDGHHFVPQGRAVVVWEWMEVRHLARRTEPSTAEDPAGQAVAGHFLFEGQGWAPLLLEASVLLFDPLMARGSIPVQVAGRSTPAEGAKDLLGATAQCAPYAASGEQRTTVGQPCIRVIEACAEGFRRIVDQKAPRKGELETEPQLSPPRSVIDRGLGAIRGRQLPGTAPLGSLAGDQRPDRAPGPGLICQQVGHQALDLR